MRRRALAAWLLVLTAAVWAQAPAARVSYTCSFPASIPAFVHITIAQDGAATAMVRAKAGEPLEALAFTASPATVEQVFKAAAALKHFDGKRLQSKNKVAFTGDKMLAYDDGGQHHAQAYRFTTVSAAAKLESLMTRIGTTALDAVELRRALRYSRLDALGMLEQFSDAWKSGQLAEPQLLTPVLRQAAGNAGLMTAARRQARELLAAMGEPVEH